MDWEWRVETLDHGDGGGQGRLGMLQDPWAVHGSGEIPKSGSRKENGRKPETNFKVIFYMHQAGAGSQLAFPLPRVLLLLLVSFLLLFPCLLSSPPHFPSLFLSS